MVYTIGENLNIKEQKIMTYQATVYRVLIASPSDVQDERKRIPEIIHTWNSMHSAHLGVVLLPVKWETHSVPRMGGRPQGIINEQLVNNCDILIGTFWTRLGTHTGKAESGTVEEIEEFTGQKKPALLYFSSRPVVPESLDHEEYSRLSKFRDSCKTNGLFDTYDSLEDLSEKINRHLTGLLQELHISNTNQPPADTVEKGNIVNEFKYLIKQYEAEWISEKESSPVSIDEGKLLLKQLSSNLLEFNISLEEIITEDDRKELMEIIKLSKSLQRHRVFLDGGKSFSQFWELGDQVINRLKTLTKTL